jgi:hypothetical protein
MLTKIKEFFLGKPKAQDPVPEAPYKVEAPVVPVAETPPSVTEPKKAPAKAKKAPAVKPAVAAKKPRAKKTPAK